jgi:hypothetical protein
MTLVGIALILFLYEIHEKSMKPAPNHEQLFDEICGKLAELSHQRQPTGFTSGEHDMANTIWAERFEKIQNQIKKSQEDLKATQEELQSKIGSLGNFGLHESDFNQEAVRLSAQLEQERQTNSKLSADLAKSLELNLKLQFEGEELRSKANQILAEEKKHNQYLMEKSKASAHELELAEALAQDHRMELLKAKDRFQADSQVRDSELEKMSEAFMSLDDNFSQQQGLMKNLASAAEKKIIELKMALDKKSVESQDYYSHLQQSLSQATILRQENLALKDYIGKLTTLHQQQQQTAQA